MIIEEINHKPNLVVIIHELSCKQNPGDDMIMHKLDCKQNLQAITQDLSCEQNLILLLDSVGVKFPNNESMYVKHVYLKRLMVLM